MYVLQVFDETPGFRIIDCDEHEDCPAPWLLNEEGAFGYEAEKHGS